MKKIADVDPKYYRYLKRQLKDFFNTIDENFKELNNRLKILEDKN